jgi:hypothetical protein
MTQQIAFSKSRFNQTISSEQLNPIIDAILIGKYSWACVLLLRCAGYNPLQYIPYRTYNRLLKENCQSGNPNQAKSASTNSDRQSTANWSGSRSSPKSLSTISDLNYLEPVDGKNTQLRGGHLDHQILLIC